MLLQTKQVAIPNEQECHLQTYEAINLFVSISLAALNFTRDAVILRRITGMLRDFRKCDLSINAGTI